MDDIDPGKLKKFYAELDDEDLDSYTIKSKLEFLLKDSPGNIEQEYKKCFLCASLMVANLFYVKDVEHQIGLPFFSEKPQTFEVHEAAYSRYQLLLVYSKTLGNLMREKSVKEKVKNELLKQFVETFDGNVELYERMAYDKVYDYNELIGGFPDLFRPDLVKFTSSVSARK